MSAHLGLGLEQLKAALEDAVLRATGRRVLTLRVRLAGPQLRWGQRWGRWGGAAWLCGLAACGALRGRARSQWCRGLHALVPAQAYAERALRPTLPP